MKIKLIIPVIKVKKIDSMFWHPETESTPQEQVNYIKNLSEIVSIKQRAELVFVTNSPYIVEAIDAYFGNSNTIFSDGEKEIEAAEFYKHFAQPMKQVTQII